MKGISIVIATLGGESLSSTLDKLNSGTVIPDEILVCIPSSEYNCSKFLFEDENIKIIPTPIRGQVAQRAYGFRRAQYEYVLQLDDDMSVDQYCLQRLVDAIDIHGTNASVSPALINEQTGRSVHAKPHGPKPLLSIYFWLMEPRVISQGQLTRQALQSEWILHLQCRGLLRLNGCLVAACCTDVRI